MQDKLRKCDLKKPLKIDTFRINSQKSLDVAIKRIRIVSGQIKPEKEELIVVLWHERIKIDKFYINDQQDVDLIVRRLNCVMQRVNLEQERLVLVLWDKLKNPEEEVRKIILSSIANS